MKDTKNKLELLMKNGIEYLSQTSEQDLSLKIADNKWSKKEILGHLIDSGIYNILRFTEIQFEHKPYKIRNYKQNELVKANDYKNADSKEIINFWWSINKRILSLILEQTENTLSYRIELDNNNSFDLRFLINDYVNHLEHHLNQIIGRS